MLHTTPDTAPRAAPLSERVPHSPTLDDLARFLNTSVKTVTRRLAAGALPIRERPRLGHVRRFHGEDLRAYLAGEAQPAGRQYFTRARRSA